MSAKQVTCGLIIEGVGEAGNAEATIYCHDYSIDEEKPEQLLSAQVASGVFVSIPRSVSTEINPIKGSYETSSFTFELLLDDETSKTFLRQATIVDAIGFLDVALDDAATTIYYEESGHDGVVVFVGSETIKLGIFDTDRYDFCTRGHHDSLAVDHPKDRRIYPFVPSWRRRQVEFVTFDYLDRQWRTRWRGQIDNINTAGNGTIIQIKCREMLADLKDSEINRGAQDIRDFGPVRAFRSKVTGKVQAVGRVTGYRSRVHKLGTTSRYLVCRVGDTPMLVPRVSDELFFNDAIPFGAIDDGVERNGQGPIMEMFCVSKELDAKYGEVSATYDLPQPYNPVAVAFAIATSTARATVDVDDRYDVLNTPFSLDLFSLLDIPSWHAAIEDAKDIEIDQIFLGWDGSFKALEIIINVLLRPYGFIATPNEEGKLGVQRILAPNIANLCHAKSNELDIISPGKGGVELVWETALESTIDTVTAIVGETPWSKGSSITIRASDESRRKAAQSDSRSFDYDLRTLKRTTVSYYGDGDRGDEATNGLINQAMQGHYASPRISFSTYDSPTDKPYDLGKYYSIGSGGPVSPWFQTKNGPRVVLPSDDEDIFVQFLGMMVSRRFDNLTQTYSVKLLLTAHRMGRVARLRAPNVFIDGSDPGDDVLYFAEGSDFGNLGNDYDCFKEGDQIQIAYESGKPWEDSVTRTIENHKGNEWQMDDWYASDPGAFEGALVVRIADAPDYNNTAHYECTNRPWTMLADVDDTILTFDGEVPADVYA